MNDSYARSVAATEQAEQTLEYRAAAKIALGKMLREMATDTQEAQRTQAIVEGTTALVEKHLREQDSTNFDALLVSVELVTRSVLDMIHGHLKVMKQEGTPANAHAFATGYMSAVAELSLNAVLTMLAQMDNKGTVQ